MEGLFSSFGNVATGVACVHGERMHSNSVRVNARKRVFRGIVSGEVV